ncbi:hypothetical protein, variant [Aphanomyces invadans]|uniref:Calcium-activated potassium channel BK alpha subunit domain-containing protein n=1 Tax=Aphanomyces invadans TaxID=157072 RepID=A0A024UJX8_9STRA|nr:hypothetical protein, variant [Aphanomyces invadans]ETW06177.1 hypothetical protein, variant [Aphanomyces invadans]|eukprot:XP_008865954.1 hypothetical protein, variant [Aphanomyces invadans]
MSGRSNTSGYSSRMDNPPKHSEAVSPSRKRRLNPQHSVTRRQSIHDLVTMTVVPQLEHIKDPRSRGLLFLVRNSGESRRDFTLRNLEQSNAGHLVDMFMVFLSLFWVAVYIYVNKNVANPKLPTEVQVLSHTLGVVFLLDYLVRLYASPLRVSHFWSFFPLVDFISLVPMVIEIVVGNDVLTHISKQTDSLRQVASMLQAAKTIRILRAYRALKFIKSTVNRQMAATGLTVVCIIIAMAGILQILDQCSPACDNFMFCSSDFSAYECPRSAACYEADVVHNCCKCQELSFFDWTYFVVVSISTLGYGDISPRGRLARLATSTMMLMTFVLVPIQINRLVATISTHSGYTSSYKEHRTHTHGIITAGGDISAGTLANFLRQFFHPNNPNWNEKIVILHPTAPSNDVQRVIHMHEPRVQYIVGSAMNDLDLDRAMISKAAVCYVLVNKDTSRPSNEDQSCTLLTAAFRGMNAAVPVYSQVFMSQNISHCVLSGATGVICVEKLKLGVLGLNCTVWGLSTLLSNLLDTVSPSVTQLYPKDSWETAYLKGYLHEIHRVDIPRSFSGLTYRDLILFLFGTLQVIPIAMLTDKGVSFAPMDFKLGATADPTICCTLYILAPYVTVADQIAEYPLEQIRLFRQTLRKQERHVAERNEAAALESAAAVPPPSVPSAPLHVPNGHDEDATKASTASTAFSALAKGLHGVKHAFGQASPYKEFMAKLLPEQLNDHVVIVGLPASLGDIIVPLRQFNARNTCGKAQAIVFIAPFAMSEHHYHSIGDSTAVYFVQGSPLSSFDLHRIHIDTASAIIILAGSGSKRKYIDENMVDADAITTVRYINEACSGSKPPNLIVELVKATNVKFMSSIVKRHMNHHRRRHSDGRHTRVVGTVTAHKYMPTDAAPPPRPGDGGPTPNKVENEDKIDVEHICEPSYASGRVYVSGMIDSLMSECYQKPNIIPAINLLMFGSPTDPDAQRLFQVRTPKSLHGKTFGECFRKVLALNLICIGCLHSSTDKTPPYVHTNPPADMIIYQTDYIYVIGKPCSDLPL